MATEPVLTRPEREAREQHINDGVTDDRLLELATEVITPSFSPGPIDSIELRFALLELYNRRTGRHA